MNVHNFVVRPKRHLVEKCAGAEAWNVLTAEALVELAGEVAGLPAELEAEDEEAKRFDLLVLAESGIGSADDVQKAKEESHGLGFFVRALVGLDREAAKQAFSGFLAGKTMTANQIDFVNLIIDHLTERGFMDPALLYASPYTDFSPKGVEGVFSSRQVDEMVSILDDIRKRAAAA